MRFANNSLTIVLGCAAAIGGALPALAQTVTPRIVAQDASLNNLVDPPGYPAVPVGTLGSIDRRGPLDGTPLILVPGLGFGAEAYEALVQKLSVRHRVLVVPLAGFGRTHGPRSPPSTTSFGEQTWTSGAVTAIEGLIREDGVKNALVVGHWIGGTQVALKLALRNPSTVRAVALIAGAGRMVLRDPRFDEYYGTIERRVASTDKMMAPGWFKTVTRETWDDNNFLPGDYSADPVLGLRLWRMAAEPPLHVWARYLCEFNAQDITVELSRLAAPTLLLRPALEGLPNAPGLDYLHDYLHASWEGRTAGVAALTIRDVPASRLFMWLDQPEPVHEALRRFFDEVLARGNRAPATHRDQHSAQGGDAGETTMRIAEKSRVSVALRKNEWDTGPGRSKPSRRAQRDRPPRR